MRKVDEFRVFLLVLFLISFIVDVFFVPSTFDLGSDARLFFLVLLWLFLSKLSHFTSRSTFKVTMGFLTILFFFFLFSRTSPILDRVASWIYIFLCIGVVQQFLESRMQNSSQKYNNSKAL